MRKCSNDELKRRRSVIKNHWLTLPVRSTLLLIMLTAVRVGAAGEPAASETAVGTLLWYVHNIQNSQPGPCIQLFGQFRNTVGPLRLRDTAR